MNFERGKELKQALNIGRIKKAYRGNYIIASIDVNPVYYYGEAFKGGSSPATVNIGILIIVDDFIQDIQIGNTKPLMEFAIQRAKERVKEDLKGCHYVVRKDPNFIFRSIHIAEDSPENALPIDMMKERDIVFRDKFYRYPEDIS